jgi:Ca2+-binding RTX toxin-like protein
MAIKKDLAKGGHTLTGTEDDDFLYGYGGNDVLIGLGGNDHLYGGIGADTMIGGLGDDHYYVDNAGDVVIEGKAEGTDTVYSSLANYTLPSYFENLELELGASNGTGNNGDNVIVGNVGINTLIGLQGNDALFGEGGPDTLIGGWGDDRYYLDSAAATVIEAFNEGNDTVRILGNFSYVLGANLENLYFHEPAGAVNGTGNELNNAIHGNDSINTLIGGGGNDTLGGGGGADTLIGGIGDDNYGVHDVGDVVIELADEGTDTVYSSVNYTLGAHVERLFLTESAGAINGTGSGLDNDIYGNSSINVLSGGAGDDLMFGWDGADTLNGGADDDNLNGGIGGDTLNGGNGNDTLNGDEGGDTMIGGAGDDEYSVSQAGDVVTENANEGTDTVYSAIGYTLGAHVEHLHLAAAAGAVNGTGNGLDNDIYGNNSINVLTGGGGDDYIDGGGNADTMIGGIGDDEYSVSDAGDVVTENANEGTDRVNATVSYTLGANIENLHLVGYSSINGTGNGFDNDIWGNSGANILDGGIGADTMTGGGGNDQYYVDNLGDVVTELADEGTDTVHSAIGYTLGAHVEHLHLTAAAGAVNGTGNGLNNDIYGNSSINVLTGGDGNDRIDGGGGADTMIGGIGDDQYTVSDAGDVVIENANEGTDRVSTTISYTLGANIEDLYLLGSSSINGTGNGLDNDIWGNDGANILDGGTGADTMVGGGGSDHYYVDNIGDVTWDTDLPGIDHVFASTHHMIGLGIEKLTLLDGAGELYGWGNGSDNEIFGNNSANVIDGQGGSDMVWGAGGNDWLVYSEGEGVDHLDGGADIDTVDFSGFGYGVWVELGYGAMDVWTNGTSNATVYGDWTDVANLDNIENIVGTSGHDTLRGDDGANRIDGRLGNDVLTGNGGQDAFVFRSFAFDGSHVDQITDFSVADDSIYIDNAAFDALANGWLAAGAFHVGSAAADADDRIIYNSATGGIFYDPDANGVGAACQFAQVSAGLALTHQDILVL